MFRGYCGTASRTARFLLLVVLVLACASSVQAKNLSNRAVRGNPAGKGLTITCPPDITVDCPLHILPEHTGWPEITGADPPIDTSYIDVDRECCCTFTFIRVWRATDRAGGCDTCMQTITADDNVPPEITYCPPDTIVACDFNVDDLAQATAIDNCDDELAMRYEATTIPGETPCEYCIFRRWCFADDCGNTVRCQQLVTVRDTEAPVLTCAPDEVIPCDAPVIFTDPEVNDVCDEMPTLIVTSTDTVPGPGPGEYTYTRCWIAYDRCGNMSEPCCQRIVIEACDGGPCTFTIGGWGSGCPGPQQGNLMSTQPGCVRDHYFSEVFPNGVVIGDVLDANTYAALWTSPGAVEAFLSDGGTPGVLTSDLTDPRSTPAGVLASQILALRLNREYSCAGIFARIGLGPSNACYGSFIIPEACGGQFAGLTVDEFLAIADQAVGGNTSELDAYGADLSDLNDTATCLNELLNDCEEMEEADGRGVTGPDDEGSEPGSSLLPGEITLSSRPNPLSGSTTISYALPVAGNVYIEIFDICGRKVTTLVSGYQEAGYHDVAWDGNDSQDSPVAGGVYFCRLQVENRPGMLEKLIKL